MRFEELSLRIPGDELRMRFHKRITVLSGLEAPERRGLVDSLVGSLANGPTGQTILVYRDSQGRRVTVSRGTSGEVVHTYDDGSFAPDLIGSLGLDGGVEVIDIAGLFERAGKERRRRAQVAVRLT